MDSVIEVMKQDMSVAIKAFEKDNFGLVNTIGNRIMSNLLIGGRNDFWLST